MTTTTRLAKCTCGRTAPSDNPHLAFFEDRSDVSRLEGCAAPGTNALGQCGYTADAHLRFAGVLRDVVRPGVWPRGMTPHEFVAPTEPEPFDRYYCGHGGWD